ncbi:uncharacterized protein LOC123263195 [Cotesia glomerata]|uniref:Odorant-binding protein n=1 Tax=Cotesia glomerata TaxID=32391 RepID=A0AAV7I687_COTGL|nr:uncharacterized protein LOC123263195 [Cotesia glomerata]KAH0554056.1 hypothetical protein KQX54_007297 [Cotesia glomerata]
MKYFALVFVGLLFTFSTGVLGEQEDCPLKKAIQASIEACKDTLTDESINLLKEDEGADNEEIRCFKACILKDSGIMEDGKIQVEKVKSALNEAVEKAEENKDKLEEMVKAIIEATEMCAEEAGKAENECEKAHLFIACLKDDENQE